MNPTNEAIAMWETARKVTIAELENIPTNRFGVAPVPGTRGVGELALHIAEVGLMMVGELTRDGGDFRRAPYEQLIAEYRAPLDGVGGKRDIVAAMKRTLKEGVRAFREAGELHMLGLVRRFDGNRTIRDVQVEIIRLAGGAIVPLEPITELAAALDDAIIQDPDTEVAGWR